MTLSRTSNVDRNWDGHGSWADTRIEGGPLGVDYGGVLEL